MAETTIEKASFTLFDHTYLWKCNIFGKGREHLVFYFDRPVPFWRRLATRVLMGFHWERGPKTKR